MLLKKFEEVNNPIIYIFGAIAISCICYGIYMDFRGAFDFYLSSLFCIYFKLFWNGILYIHIVIFYDRFVY